MSFLTLRDTTVRDTAHTRFLWLNGFSGLELIVAHRSRSAQGRVHFITTVSCDISRHVKRAQRDARPCGEAQSLPLLPRLDSRGHLRSRRDCVVSQPPFGVDGRHSATARRSHGLPVHAILHIPGCKDTGHTRVRRPGLSADITQLVHLKPPLEDRRVGLVADSHKQSAYGQSRAFVSLHMAEVEPFDRIIS
jgi:hypothetical protein